MMGLLRPLPSLPALGLDAVELLLLVRVQDYANAGAGALDRRLDLGLDRLPDLDDVPVRLGDDGAHLFPLGYSRKRYPIPARNRSASELFEVNTRAQWKRANQCSEKRYAAVRDASPARSPLFPCPPAGIFLRSRK